MKKQVMGIKRGLQHAGLWLFGIAWLGLVFAGMAIAFTPSPHAPITGYILLGVAAVTAFATVQRWVKVFPALLAYGTFGGVLSLLDGHALNHPEVPISRLDGVLMILFFVIATVLSVSFLKRKLHILDRVALLLFVVCFFWQAVVPALMWPILSVGLFCLLVAWLYNRFRHWNEHGPDSTSRAAFNR